MELAQVKSALSKLAEASSKNPKDVSVQLRYASGLQEAALFFAVHDEHSAIENTYDVIRGLARKWPNEQTLVIARGDIAANFATSHFKRILGGTIAGDKAIVSAVNAIRDAIKDATLSAIISHNVELARSTAGLYRMMAEVEGTRVICPSSYYHELVGAFDNDSEVRLELLRASVYHATGLFKPLQEVIDTDGYNGPMRDLVTLAFSTAFGAFFNEDKARRKRLVEDLQRLARDFPDEAIFETAVGIAKRWIR